MGTLEQPSLFWRELQGLGTQIVDSYRLLLKLQREKDGHGVETVPRMKEI